MTLMSPRARRRWLAIGLLIGSILLAVTGWLQRQQERAWAGADRPRIDWVKLPGGAFEMGSDVDFDASPRHTVLVGAFELGRTEVTVAQYARCVAADACPAIVPHPGCNQAASDRGTHPANCVTWQGAQAFCVWIGARLPTEAEWEYAARSGGRDQRYPWGDEPVSCAIASIDSPLPGCGSGATSPVRSRPAGRSAQGVYNLIGNVAEWTGDWYAPYEPAPAVQPAGPATGTMRVVRGCGWGSALDECTALRRNRYQIHRPNIGYGFRPARSTALLAGSSTAQQAQAPTPAPQAPGAPPALRDLITLSGTTTEPGAPVGLVVEAAAGDIEMRYLESGARYTLIGGTCAVDEDAVARRCTPFEAARMWLVRAGLDVAQAGQLQGRNYGHDGELLRTVGAPFVLNTHKNSAASGIVGVSIRGQALLDQSILSIDAELTDIRDVTCADDVKVRVPHSWQLAFSKTESPAGFAMRSGHGFAMLFHSSASARRLARAPLRPVVGVGKQTPISHTAGVELTGVARPIPADGSVRRTIEELLMQHPARSHSLPHRRYLLLDAAGRPTAAMLVPHAHAFIPAADRTTWALQPRRARKLGMVTMSTTAGLWSAFIARSERPAGAYTKRVLRLIAPPELPDYGQLSDDVMRLVELQAAL